MTPLWNKDYLALRGDWDTAFGQFGFEYARSGFAQAVSDAVSSTITPIEFLLDGRSTLNALASLSQGPLTFKASGGIVAQYEADASWNGSTALPAAAATLSAVDVWPVVALQVNVNVF
jgi:hypothetical protein